MNLFKSYIDLLLAILVMFVFIILNFSQKQDVLTQVFLEIKAKEFTDNVSVHGYITIAMYETFIARLENTGGSFSIELIHTKNMYEPEYENEVFLDKVMFYTEENYTDEIMETLYKEGIYYFELDERFRVTIRNRTHSFGMQYFKNLFRARYTNEVTKVVSIRDSRKESNTSWENMNSQMEN